MLEEKKEGAKPLKHQLHGTVAQSAFTGEGHIITLTAREAAKCSLLCPGGRGNDLVSAMGGLRSLVKRGSKQTN